MLKNKNKNFKISTANYGVLKKEGKKMEKDLEIMELGEGVNYIYSRNREKFNFKNVTEEVGEKNEKSFCNLVKELQNNEIKLTQMYIVKCVHGNKIVDMEVMQKDSQIIEINYLQSGLKLITPKIIEADGIVTNDITKMLGMFPADCGILGIYDPVEKRKALIHSGWRGALQDIAVRAIDIFRMKGSKLSNLKVILSPMIKSLEIGIDTIFMFDEYVEKKGPDYKKFIKKSSENYLVNLKEIIVQSLLDRGIKKENILNINSEDTFSEVDQNCRYLYESYRRDKEKSRRNIIIIYFIPKKSNRPAWVSDAKSKHVLKLSAIVISSFVPNTETFSEVKEIIKNDLTSSDIATFEKLQKPVVDSINNDNTSAEMGYKDSEVRDLERQLQQLQEATEEETILDDENKTSNKEVEDTNNKENKQINIKINSSDVDTLRTILKNNL